MSDMIADKRKEFIKTLGTLATKRDIMTAFADVVGAMSCSLEQFCHAFKSREGRFKSIISRYDDEEQIVFHRLLAIVIEALEIRRESFLGPILEEIGAANTRNGQFLTPASVAKMMGRITTDDMIRNHVKGELITLNDPACGAGVLLIEGAENLVQNGVSQRDIMIYAGDIDQRACDMAFIELSLLGYAARVEHLDALSMTPYSRPRWTIGYFLHGTQFRDKSDKIPAKEKAE